jgi:HTH-type transcriptional regulator, quorum sensing regulator NprR
MTTLGAKIRQLRKQRRMTQQALADGIVTASMISQIEADRAVPSRKVLEQIAERLGVPASHFMEELTQKSDQSSTYRKAKHLLERGAHEEALPLLLSLVEHSTPQFREVTIYSDLAICYEKLNQLSEASKMYEQVVRCSLERDDIPTAVHAYYNAGHLQRRIGRISHARMYWLRAYELLRRHPDVKMPIAMKIAANLGRVYLIQKQFGQALACLTQAVSLAEEYSSPLDSAIIHHGLATAYVEVENYEKAETHTDLAMSLYEKVRNQRGINQCLVNKGYILRHQGKYEAAIQHLTTCISNRELLSDLPGLANALGERARCYAALHQNDRAVMDAERALALSPPPELYLSLASTLAEIYLAENKMNEALELVAGCEKIASATEDIQLYTMLEALECKARTLKGDYKEGAEAAARLSNYLLQHVAT